MTPEPEHEAAAARAGAEATNSVAADEAGMARAMAIAATVRLATSPRPWVGAVVEPPGWDGDERDLFAGATDGVSGPHAEVVALRLAGDAARGATLYVTLEPCSHWGRTPPCVDAVRAAGVRRVVVGTVDPDTKVAGTGIAQLRAAGVEVIDALEESEHGRFGWAVDPAGTRFELWEPAPGS